jgi:hypothetical protein
MMTEVAEQTVQLNGTILKKTKPKTKKKKTAKKTTEQKSEISAGAIKKRLQQRPYNVILTGANDAFVTSLCKNSNRSRAAVLNACVDLAREQDLKLSYCIPPVVQKWLKKTNKKLAM